MMNGKLKNAPYLMDQPNDPFSQIVVLAGSKAWQAYSKGKSTEWAFLCQAIGNDEKQKPIILGTDQLAEINQLRLAQETHKFISIYQIGELKQAEISGIAANLARHSNAETVALYDNIGQLKENLTEYIQRLRNDEESQRLIEQANQNQQPNRNEPYIELRDNGKLKGLYYVTPKYDKDGIFIREDQKWLCDELALVGNGKSENGEYFYIFQWQNADEKEPRIEAINQGEFGTDTAWKQLKSKGLKMTPRTLTQHLVEHFHALGIYAPRWTVTHCTGWHNGAYLLPSGEIIGKPKQPIIFKNKSASANGYNTRGTLESWQQEIARYVNKNTSMMLGVATALASPLLRLLNADSFGVHLFNASSKGKTTTLNIANSIYGDPQQIDLSWNTTPTALNNEASSRNDGFITLDELGQAKKIYDVENIAYALFNEKGRAQGMKEGGNNELNRWKITALSTGEKDVEGFLKSKGVDINAGQLVRLLNVPLIEAHYLHGFGSNKAHADHLNEASKTNYGIIGREWIAYLAENVPLVKSEYKRINQQWQERLAENASSQVQRVASRFAVLETALQLAKHLTQWTEEDNREALLKSFNDWLADFGNGDREETKIIEFVNGWLDENAESLFIQVPNDGSQRPLTKVCGYRVLEVQGISKEHFYIYPKSFTDLIFSSGHPKKVFLQTLERNKMITPSKEQEKRPYQHKVPADLNRHIKSSGRRYYVVYPCEILDDDLTNH